MEQLSTSEIVAFVFIDIAVIIVAARLFGRLAVALRQPAVVGEILAGVLLGPTLLGALPGDLDDKLFPADVRPYLYVLAQLGLILFMFIVGLELDAKLIRGRERVAGAISLSSVMLPFALGFGLTLLLHPLHDTVDGVPVPFLAMALFVGVAMSITAFPVLARILGDRGMHRTPAGVLALACAAVDDILAWTLLAFVVAVAKGGSLLDVVRIVALTAVFATFMFVLVRPLLKRLVTWHQAAGRLTPDVLAVVLIGVLLSSYATDKIGIHSIFGAFIFGAIMPREGAVALTRDILERLEQVSVLLLLPVFFVIAGFGVDVGGLGFGGLWQLALVLLVAIGGKFVGATFGARMMQVPPRQASVIGVLMNTRGLTELVILQIGRDLGVLDGELFTMMVLMALVTTAMTEPLLRFVYPDRILKRDIEAAERAALGIVESYQVLTVVEDDPVVAARLIEVGCDLTGPQHPAGVVIDRLVDAPRSRLEVGTGLLPDLAAMAGAVDELKQLAPVAVARGVPAQVITRFTADPWTDLASQAGVVDADVVLVPEGWAAERSTVAVTSGSAAAGAGAEGGSGADGRSARGAAADGGVGGLGGGGVLGVRRRAGVGRGGASDGLARVGRTVVTVRLGAPAEPGAPVLVSADGSADGRTALRLALHIAVRRGVPLLVADDASGRGGRRIAAGVEQLARAGFAVRLVSAVEAAAADPAVRVLPAGSEGPPAPDAPDSGVPALATGLAFATVLTVRAGQADADLDLTEALADLSPPTHREK